MEIDLTRHHGAVGIGVAECIDERFGTWRVRTDLQPLVNEETGEQDGVTFVEIEFPYKPSMSEVKDFVYGVVNAKTTARIISGFTYTVKHGAQAGTEVNVWLSSANQQDFHAMHRNSDGLTFPVRYKVGEIDGTPVYEEFADGEEMHAICVSTTNHVLSCQQEGWAEKDSIDLEPYKALFPQPDQTVNENS